MLPDLADDANNGFPQFVGPTDLELITFLNAKLFSELRSECAKIAVLKQCILRFARLAHSTIYL